MSWKPFVKPNYKNVLITLFLFGISSFLSYETFWSGRRLGFPAVFYQEIGYIPLCRPTPCPGVYRPFLPLYFSALLVILNLFCYYATSLLLLDILHLVLKRRHHHKKLAPHFSSQ